MVVEIKRRSETRVVSEAIALAWPNELAAAFIRMAASVFAFRCRTGSEEDSPAGLNALAKYTSSSTEMRLLICSCEPGPVARQDPRGRSSWDGSLWVQKCCTLTACLRVLRLPHIDYLQELWARRASWSLGLSLSPSPSQSWKTAKALSMPSAANCKVSTASYRNA